MLTQLIIDCRTGSLLAVLVQPLLLPLSGDRASRGMLWQKHTYDLAVVIGGIPQVQQCLGFRHGVTPNGLETQICVESRIRIECFEYGLQMLVTYSLQIELRCVVFVPKGKDFHLCFCQRLNHVHELNERLPLRLQGNVQTRQNMSNNRVNKIGKTMSSLTQNS